MKFEWELIYKSEDFVTKTYRAKVIGGWLIRDFQCIFVDNHKTLKTGTRDYTISNAMTFISDPIHEWSIE